MIPQGLRPRQRVGSVELGAQEVAHELAAIAVAPRGAQPIQHAHAGIGRETVKREELARDVFLRLMGGLALRF